MPFWSFRPLAAPFLAVMLLAAAPAWAQRTVALELVLAVDCSSSVDEDEFELQSLEQQRNKFIAIVCSSYGISVFAHLLLILIGYRAGGSPPIMDPGVSPSTFAASAVDPIPQALVLTSIVIGLGVLALMVALCIRLYERY